MRFKDIEISNFRGIKNIRLENLGLINVFLGRNNVGKSTLLESIFMLAGMTNPMLPSQLNFIRESKHGDMSYVKYLFNKVNLSEHPLIKGSTTNDEVRKVEIVAINNIETPNNKNLMGLSSKDNNYINGVELICDDGKQSFSTKLINNNGKLSLSSTIEYIENIKAILISSNSKEGNVLEGYSELVRRKQKDAIIQALNNFDSRIISIEALSDGLYLQFQGIEELLPISMAGDGVRRFLGIVAFIVDPTTDIVLIDEIENGLHYTAYSKLWESLIRSAMQNNVQLFVTTHSDETLKCLSRIYEQMQVDNNIKSEDIRVYTIDKEIDGQQQAYSLSAEGLLGAIENNIEIRK